MILRILEAGFEYLAISLPIFLIVAVISFGGFAYYNHREKNICSKKICRLEKKLEKLKTKLYYLPLWLILFPYQSI